MVKITILIYGIFILILTYLWFLPLNNNEFFYIHDQSPTLSQGEFISKLSAWDSSSGGFDNRQAIIKLVRSSIYGIPLQFGISISLIQYIYFSLLLFLPFTTMYILLSFVFKEKKQNLIYILIPILGGLLYTFNFYTLLEWHSGHYTNHGIHYSVFPIFLLGLISINKNKSIKRSVKIGLIFGLIIGLASSVNPPNILALYISSIPIIAFIFFKAYKDQNLTSIFLYLLAYFFTIIATNIWWILPYITFIFDTVGELQSFSAQSEISTSQYDSIFYSLNHIFKWTFFGKWNGRDFQSYVSFYRHSYVMIYWGIYSLASIALILRNKKNLKNYVLIGATSSFLLSLFFAKGLGEPFDEIFSLATDKVPLFFMFRNPGNKFGAGVILFFTLISSHALNELFNIIKYKKYFVIAVSVLLISIHFLILWPFFTGIIVQEKNIGNYPDNIISLPKGHDKLTSLLKNQSGRILIIPSYPYGKFKYIQDDSDFSYVGPDIYGKLISNRIVYNSEYARINISTADKIKNVYKTFSIDEINNLDINYIILRKDDIRETCSKACEKLISENFHQAYLDDNLTLFEINDSFNTKERINATDLRTGTYYPIEIINKYPWEYEFRIIIDPKYSEIPNTLRIQLLEGKSNLWDLNVENNILNIPLNKPNHSYGNHWELLNVKDLQGKDGETITIEGKIYYSAQDHFYIGAIISISITLFIILTIVILSLYKKKS